MVTKAQLTRWMAQIDKRMVAVGKERDKLDSLISNLRQVEEDCADAYYILQDARDALSRLV